MSESIARTWAPSESNSVGHLLLAFVLGFGTMLLTAMSFATPDRVWKQWAVKHNAAEWRIVDEATGKTEFQWKDEK